MDQYFRISFTTKLMSLFCKFLFQRTVILNDAIMNKGQFAVGRSMRMGIYIVGFTMGSPSCMSNSDVTFQILLKNGFFKI